MGPLDVVKEVAVLSLPPSTNRRLLDLMDRNTDGRLTPEEKKELEGLAELIETIGLLRAKALLVAEAKEPKHPLSKRGRLLLAAGLVIILAWVGLTVVRSLSRPAPAVSRENFRLLEAGMTERQCDAILLGQGTKKKRDRGGCISWSRENDFVEVFFTEGPPEQLRSASFGFHVGDGYTTLESGPPAPQTFLERIWRALGL